MEQTEKVTTPIKKSIHTSEWNRFKQSREKDTDIQKSLSKQSETVPLRAGRHALQPLTADATGSTMHDLQARNVVAEIIIAKGRRGPQTEGKAGTKAEVGCCYVL